MPSPCVLDASSFCGHFAVGHVQLGGDIRLCQIYGSCLVHGPYPSRTVEEPKTLTLKKIFFPGSASGSFMFSCVEKLEMGLSKNGESPKWVASPWFPLQTPTKGSLKKKVSPPPSYLPEARSCASPALPGRRARYPAYVAWRQSVYPGHQFFWAKLRAPAGKMR